MDKNTTVLRTDDVEEFKSPAGSKMTAHYERLLYCKVKGSIFTGSSPLYFWANHIEVDPENKNVIVLKSVLFETSERQQGITLVQRMTWYKKVTLYGMSLISFPYVLPMAEYNKAKKEGGANHV